MRFARLLTAALALGALAPAAARAQFIPGPVNQGGPTRAVIVGPRLGWSIRDSSPALGGQLRVPFPIARVRPAITVGGDVVFQSGLREFQGTADATFGFFAPLYVGGGAAVLNSVFDDGNERATKLGFSVVGGIGGGRVGPFLTQIEFRYLKVDELSPRFITLTLGYPLIF
jgi:hypothetical protein